MGGIPVGQPGLLRLRWSLLLALLALLVAPLDAAFAHAANPLHPAALDRLALWFDAWSTRLLLLILFGGLLLAFTTERFRAWREPTLGFTLGWVLTEALVGALKRVVGRPRPIHPDGLGDALRALYDRPDTLSFPSGHSATAFAAALGFALWFRRPAVARVAFSFAVLVALSRCYVGAHYLSDVLAGAAIGLASVAVATKGVALVNRIHTVDLMRESPTAIGLIAVVILTWLLKEPRELIDWATGEPTTAFAVRTPLVRLLFEPLIGFGTKVSTLPDLRPWCVRAAAWLGLVVILIVIARRRRALGPVAIVAAFAGFTAWAALGGLAAPGRLGVRSRAGLDHPTVFDLQAHIGDPTDGHMDLERGLARYADLGYDLVVPTWHNTWSPAWLREGDDWRSVDLHAMEWSAGDHLSSPLHLLVFNRVPEPHDLADERDWRRLVHRVQEAGGLVVVSHFWRGPAAEMPSLDELVAGGVDGFEVKGRCEEHGDEPLARQRAIAAAVQTRELVGVADGDFHGRRSANYQWNVVEAGATPPVEAVWRALWERREIRALTLESPRPLAIWRGPLEPWYTLATYLRELSLAQRGVWMAWAVALLVWSVWRRRKAGISTRSR